MNVIALPIVVIVIYSGMLFVHPSSDHPLFLAYILLSMMALFKSYPSIGDLALPLSLLPLWSHTFRCERTLYITSIGSAIMRNTVISLQTSAILWWCCVCS